MLTGDVQNLTRFRFLLKVIYVQYVDSKTKQKLCLGKIQNFKMLLNREYGNGSSESG